MALPRVGYKESAKTLTQPETTPCSLLYRGTSTRFKAPSAASTTSDLQAPSCDYPTWTGWPAFSPSPACCSRSSAIICWGLVGGSSTPANVSSWKGDRAGEVTATKSGQHREYK